MRIIKNQKVGRNITDERATTFKIELLKKKKDLSVKKQFQSYYNSKCPFIEIIIEIN